MIYSFITAILFVLMILAGVALIVFNFLRNRKSKGYSGVKNKVLMPVAAALIGSGMLLLILIPGSFHTVEAGTVAVVKQMGVIADIEGPGTYFDFYLVRTYEEYDAKVQQVEINDNAYTADAQSMEIHMVVQFQIRQDNVKDIALNYGGMEALTNRIQSVAIERTKAMLSGYQAEKLIEQRNSVSPDVEKAISEAIGDKYYVTFNSAVLTDITFSDAFEAAVEAKMMAQQEKLQAQYENEKKKEQAETALYVGAGAGRRAGCGVQGRSAVDYAQKRRSGKNARLHGNRNR